MRDEANTDSPVIDLIGHGEQIEVGEEEDGWLQIIYSDGEIDYVSADYVEVSYNYGEAKTMEQIEAEEAARRAEEEKAKRTKNLGAIAASTDEVTLLAALIQSESGNQPYEGQLGSWRSGHEPGTERILSEYDSGSDLGSRDSLDRQLPEKCQRFWPVVRRQAVCRQHRRLSMVRPPLERQLISEVCLPVCRES